MRLLAGILLTLLLVIPAAAQERITLFDVEVEVEQDGDLIVSQRIEVVAEGDQIRRGIFQDFPTRFRSRNGFNQYAAFDVQRVTRNGVEEPYRVERQVDYARLYVGSEDVIIPRGRHVYEIVFRTDNQIGFFENHDELYYNLIGTGWAFPIEEARGRVILPEGAEVGEATVYQGRQGTSAERYQAEVRGRTISFMSPRPLRPNEGMTFVVTWQKGLIAPPGRAALLAQNIGTVVGALGFFGLLAYFVRLWRRVGRDPAKGLIIPLFRPPHGLSPVALGYVDSRGFQGKMSGGKAFAIALTSLATKGYLTLTEEGRKSFLVSRTAKLRGELPPGEAAVLGALFEREGDGALLSGTYDPRIAAAQKSLFSAVEREYADDYFRTNRGIWLTGALLGAIVCLLTAVLNVPLSEISVIAGMITVFLSLATSGLYFVVRNLLLSRKGGTLRLMLKLFIALVTALGFMVPIGMLALISLGIIGWPAVIIIIATNILVCVFFWLLEAPTVMGRKVMDEIEGYKLFLAATEWDRMASLGGPQRLDAKVFEEHLPYSMALGVDEEWSRAFAASAQAAGQRPEEYRPGWYSGSRGFSSSRGLASALSGTMASTISAAASPPSSSSGSGGGGSSGGGGGGGGGGGW